MFWRLSGLVLPVLFLFSTVLGAEIRVEKDGSGDFTTIQDAVDAAQEGDTIRIGPGLFTETHSYNLLPPYHVIPYCAVLDKSLQIVGSGVGVTILEPEDLGLNQNEAGAIVGAVPGLEVMISDLTIRQCPGMAVRFRMEAEGRLDVLRVAFENCWVGVHLFGTRNSQIRDCTFEVTGSIIDYGIEAFSLENLIVENCRFNGKGIRFGDADHSEIRSCQFLDPIIGITLHTGYDVSVSDCQMTGCSFRGMLIDDGYFYRVSDVTITGPTTEGALILTGTTQHLELRDSIIQGGHVSMYLGCRLSSSVVTNNHILPSDEGWTVWSLPTNYGYPMHVDLTGNYWGTDDPDEVEASIHDASDDEDLELFIGFLPMAGGPVSTQQQSLGGVKALFR